MNLYDQYFNHSAKDNARLEFIRLNGDNGLRPDDLRGLFVLLLRYVDELEERIKRIENRNDIDDLI